MGFLWAADLRAGAEASDDDLAGAGVGRTFPSQADAEAWLAENYEELSDLGVSRVSLFEDERCVYGPMSLDEQ